MRATKSRQNHRGYSLMELVVVMAVLALIVLISAAPMKTFYFGWQIKETAQKISIFVQKARFRAVSMRAPLTLTFTRTATAFTVELREGWGGTGPAFQRDLIRIDRAKDAVQIGWDDNSGSSMTNPLVLTFNADGSVTSSPAGAATNSPPRIDVYDRRYPTRVPPAYVRIGLRGSVYTGKLASTWGSTQWDVAGYYNVSNGVPHAEELRRGVSSVTTEK